MPVLDTNFLIALHEREASAIRLLETLQGEPLLVPSIVAVEFLTAFDDPTEAYDELERGFQFVHTSREWVRTATLRRQKLRRQGKSIRLADFWIATWAFLHDTFVVTRDAKDFQALGVAARTW